MPQTQNTLIAHEECLRELTRKATAVADIYTRKNNIESNGDWLLIKLYEELGELSQAYLRMSGRGRAAPADTRAAFEAELADVLGFVLLFAGHHDVNLGKALADKWLWRLEPKASGSNAP